MDFGMTDTQQAIWELSRQILEERASHEELSRLEAQDVWHSSATWGALAEAELLGLALPEECGGGDMGLGALATLMEEIGRAAAPVPVLSHVVGGLALAHDGAHSEVLASAATGATLLTVALVDDEPKCPSTRVEGATLSGVRACVPSW